MRSLIFRSFQSPGDAVMVTAAVRDLHVAHPGQFETDIRTAADSLFDNNPYIKKLREGAPGVEVVDLHYPLIHQCNTRPYHFLHGYPQYLEQILGVRIPVSRFAGDIHLSPQERQSPPPGAELGVPERYWIVMAGGKYDFTAKWWNPASYQAVVDHFQGKITFVQCGEKGHWHPPLTGVVNLIGRTTLREFVRLMYHADGVLCPVTLAMHLAAAVETRPGRPKNRACVVVAGGREPPSWEAYPHHQYLSMVGTLPCCETGGCWKSRCQLVGDGDAKDRHDLCQRPIQITPDLRIPECLELIRPEDVIRAISRYYEGGLFKFGTNGHTMTQAPGTDVTETHGNGHAPPHKSEPALNTCPPRTSPPPSDPPRTRAPATDHSLLLEFRHGLGDAVQLTVVLQHLQKLRPDWAVDVAAFAGKNTAFAGLCRRSYALDRDPLDRQAYQQVHSLDWHECRTAESGCPSTKPSRCLREVFQIEPDPELCRYKIAVRTEITDRVRRYLAELCPQGPNPDGRWPVVLIHYEGNTSSDRKNLPLEVITEACQLIQELSYVPVILDWDRRSPLPDNVRIHCPGAGHPLWGGLGTGDAETLAALIGAAALMIGIDSGPLHVAGATETPTLGVWTGHHPVHYFDLSDNVLHLVPGDHVALAAGPAAQAYFEQNYRHRAYKQLDIDLLAQIEASLTGRDFEDLSNKRYLKRLTSTAYSERYYLEHKQAGLDYLGFGEWQQQYGRWLIESLDWKGKLVLEVGCACGSIMRGLGEAGAIVQGVDLAEHMIQLGRAKWPDMSRLLHVCDAVNLHLFADETWDAIHTAQVAEHWKPKLVPLILEELARVTKPGGLLFCALDTEELFARQGRSMEHEDPTHICIKPLAWWHEQLALAGWRLCTDEVADSLHRHPENFFKRYDWDWFAARKIEQLPVQVFNESHAVTGQALPDDESGIPRSAAPAGPPSTLPVAPPSLPSTATTDLAIYVLTWKRPEYLARTLRSVVAQIAAEPHLSISLNVVNNGTDAATRAVLEEFAPHLSSVLLLQENLGLSLAYERIIPRDLRARCLMFSEDDMEYRLPFGRYVDLLLSRPDVGAATGYISPEHSVHESLEFRHHRWQLKWMNAATHIVMRTETFQSFRPLRIDNWANFDVHLFSQAPNSLQKRGLPIAVLPGGAIHFGLADSTWTNDPVRRPELTEEELQIHVAASVV